MHNDVPIPIRFGIRAVAAVLLVVLMAKSSADPAIARTSTPAPTQSSAMGNWTQLVYTNTGPSPRYDHAAILDPVRNNWWCSVGEAMARWATPGRWGG